MRFIRMASSNSTEQLFQRKALSPAFTYTQARAAGISAERLYAHRSQGLIDQVARG